MYSEGKRSQGKDTSGEEHRGGGVWTPRGFPTISLVSVRVKVV